VCVCVCVCMCVIIITTLEYEKSGSNAVLSCACQNREQETSPVKQRTRTMPRQPARRDTARPRERPQETCRTEQEAETQNTPKHTLDTQNNKRQQIGGIQNDGTGDESSYAETVPRRTNSVMTRFWEFCQQA